MIFDTRKIASDYRFAHWAEIIRGQSESGLSIKDYCEREGFHENRFYYWRKKLRECACEHAMEMKTGTLQVKNLPQRFTEALVPNASKLPDSDVYLKNNIRIEIPGITLTADHEYPTSKIAELLKGLMQL